MSEMTLEQIRDELRNSVSLVHKPSFSRLDELADAIDAHLTSAPVQMTDGMVYASDVMAALRQVADFVFVHQGWELSNIHLWIEESFGESLSARMAQPMAAKVPEELPRNGVTVREHEYNAGWNDCREVMLSHMNESQPHSQAAQGGEAQGKVVECGGCAPPIIAMHSAERAAVPEGMVLVPREPTQKMIMAGSASLKCDVDYTRRPQMPTRQRAARNAYVSMLSAAPTLAGKEKG
ncbi:hypothetical protein FHW84_001775 [Dyella sp. SG562]|uniref:hypothetical protein n=1 Tax=Dyella sp. SG562 TaxID=2587017 RepID=UPI00142483CE|nr:hypothetical protein [Dyella sp. SG562]NII73206.1 hypothetical protein [Dyella sp. SG562]